MNQAGKFSQLHSIRFLRKLRKLPKLYDYLSKLYWQIPDHRNIAISEYCSAMLYPCIVLFGFGVIAKAQLLAEYLSGLLPISVIYAAIWWQ